MALSNRKHQQNWKAKQISAGKQPVTIMLPANIKTLIDRTRKRTGETIASVIERAILSLRRDLVNNHPHAKKIYKLIGTFHNSGLNFMNIAYILNIRNYKTFCGKDKWMEKDVKEVVKDIETGLYHKLL